jgi:hypothetical protein
MNKSDKIREYFRKFPDAEVAKVVAKFQSSKPMTYKLRNEVRNEVKPSRKVTVTTSQIAIAKKLGLTPRVYIQRLHEAGALPYDDERVPEVETVKVEETLDARAQDYGTFRDSAALMQGIKRLLADHAAKHGKTFADDQWEALEMIVHKIGRIVNGNPDKVDSWVDIAGYATLIADRLQGNAR